MTDPQKEKPCPVRDYIGVVEGFLMANGVRLGLVAVLSLGLTAGTGLLGLAGAQTPWTAPASEKGRENPLPADAKTVA